MAIIYSTPLESFMSNIQGREFIRAIEVALAEAFPTHRFVKVRIDRAFDADSLKVTLIKSPIRRDLWGSELEWSAVIDREAIEQRKDGDFIGAFMKQVMGVARELINRDRMAVGRYWANQDKNKKAEMGPSDIDSYAHYLETSLMAAEKELAQLRIAARSMAFDLEMSRNKSTAMNVRALHKIAVEQAADALMDHGVITDSADLVKVCEQIKSLQPEEGFIRHSQRAEGKQ